MEIHEIWKIISTSLISSGIVVGLLYFIMKKYVENRLKFHFDEKLEEIKNVLSIVAQDVIKPRIEGYGKLASLIYFVRTKCRDLVLEADIKPTQSIQNELQDRIEDFKNLLVDYRGYFENKIFESAHQFKNKLVLFHQLLDDLLFYDKHNTANKIAQTKTELNRLYKEIDSDYREIIKNLGITEIMVDFDQSK